MICRPTDRNAENKPTQKQLLVTPQISWGRAQAEKDGHITIPGDGNIRTPAATMKTENSSFINENNLEDSKLYQATDY